MKKLLLMVLIIGNIITFLKAETKDNKPDAAFLKHWQRTYLPDPNYDKPKTSRWRGMILKAPENAPEPFIEGDYGKARYGKSWDFNDGSFCGIDAFEGIGNQRVEDGILKFKTDKKKAIFYWGDLWNKHEDMNLEAIGFDDTEMKESPVYGLEVRIRQSKPESIWRTRSRCYRVDKPEDVKLIGTDWQTMVIPIQASPMACKMIEAIGLETDTPDNKVEIDYVKVGKCRAVQYYRSEINLPDRAVDAQFQAFCSWGYELIVNGQRVGKHVYGWGQGALLFSLDDWQRYLQKGKNVIGIIAHTSKINQSLNHWSQTYLWGEGVITLDNGKQVFFQTDENWLCSAEKQKNLNWATSEFDPVKWKKAKIRMSMKKYAHSNMSFRFREPYYQGPIFISHPDRRSPVYKAKDEVKILIGTPRQKDGGQWQLKCELKDAFDNTIIEPESYSFNPGGETAQTWLVPYTFNAKTLPPSVYNLDITAELPDGEKDTRRFEFAVTGLIAMRPDNGKTFDSAMKLKLVDSVDCTDESPSNPFLEFNIGDKADSGWFQHAGKLNPNDYQDRIINAPIGKYRELGKYPDYAMWILRPGNFHRPHVLRVTYPDNAERALDIYVCQPNRLVPLAPGKIFSLPTITGFGYPLSHKMCQAQSVFWPSEKDIIVLAVNPHKLNNFERPALAKIELFEIENDLPALTIVNPNPERMIGYTHERGIAGESFFDRYYGGPAPVGLYTQRLMNDSPGSLREQFRLASNAARWLRFTGQNLHVFGCWQYTQIHGKCKYVMAAISPISTGWKTTYQPMDVIAAMFDDNNLNFMLMTEFRAHSMLNPHDSVSDYDVQQGAENVSFVDVEGNQSEPGGGNHNFMASPVRKFLLEMWKDLAEDYKQFKSFKGLYNWTGAGVAQGQPSFIWGTRGIKADPLRYGWDDLSVSRFEKTTGVKIPVNYNDPHRFMKRYGWVMENARDKWIEWRCRELKRIIDEGGAAMRNVRSDLRFTVVFGNPGDDVVNHMAGLESYLEKERERGRDWSLYKNDPNVTITFFLRMNDRFGVGRKLMEATREFMLDEEMQKAMGLGHSSGVLLKSCVNEFGGLILRKDWKWNGRYTNFFNGCPHSYHYRDYFTNLVPYADPVQVTHTFTDCGVDSSYGQALRGIMPDWRTMPVGDYEILKGQGLDKNIIIRKLAKPLQGRTYFQLINPEWWTGEIELKFPQKTSVTRLASGAVLNTDEDGKLVMPIINYGIISLASNGAVPISADVRISSEGQNYVTEIIKNLDNIDDLSKALAADYIQKTKNAFAAGNLVKAYRYARGVELRGQITWAMISLKNNDKAYPAAWKIIGPFDNAKNANFATAQGPETDILSGKTPAKSYPGLKGKPVLWQIIKPEKNLSGLVDLNELYSRPDWVTAYATFTIKSPEDKKVFFFIGSDDGYRLWVNGKLVAELDDARGATPMQEVYKVDLKKGDNVILLKISEQVGAYKFYFSMMDDKGRPLNDCTMLPKAPAPQKLTNQHGLLLLMDEIIKDDQGHVMLKDSSGNNNHFYLINKAYNEDGSVKQKDCLSKENSSIQLVNSGKYGKALRVSSPGLHQIAYAECELAEDKLKPYLDGSFTIEAWIKFESSSEEWKEKNWPITLWPGVFMFEDSVGLGFIPNQPAHSKQKKVVPQSQIFLNENKSTSPCALKYGSWDADRWYHVAVVFDKDVPSWTSYIDGKIGYAAKIPPGTAHGRIPRSHRYRIGGSLTPMLIDELRVTPKALKPYEFGLYTGTFAKKNSN